MTLKSSSHKQFKAMLCTTMKQTSVMAILAFLCFSFFTFMISLGADNEDLYDHISGFFWDDLRNPSFSIFPNAAFIAAGVINAMLSFNFCWSKKQSNVIFSLGMRRSDIYIAKISGGLIPMAITIIVSGFFETLSCAVSGGTLDERFLGMALLTCLQFYSIYALSYILSCAVMSNSGNAVEALIFTAILSVFTMFLDVFIDSLMWSYTHGASITMFGDSAEPLCNWSKPFIAFTGFTDEFMPEYFNIESRSELTINHWSGIISATVYAIIVSALGFWGFSKRRNEICGTWGRAKVMNEISGTVSGFYAFYFFAFEVFSPSHGDGNLLTFIIGCIAFFVCYVIFRLISGYKRKKEFKESLKRFPVYASAFGIVCLVFSGGMFGYSNKIPEVDDIVSVRVSSHSYIFMDDMLADSSIFGLKSQNIRKNFIRDPINLDFTPGSSYYVNYYEIDPDYSKFPGIFFSEKEDIRKVVDVHKKLIDDGKIKNDSAHSVGANITISYTLKDGTTLTRYYTETTEGAAEKLISLNNTDPVKQTLKTYLNASCDLEAFRDMLFKRYSEHYFSFSENNGIYDRCIYNNYKGGLISSNNCYLFPKDMSSGYSIGLIDKDLFNALTADMIKLDAQKYFFHDADDEIGILSFGLSNFESEFYDKFPFTEEQSFSDDGTQTTSWNINSDDIKAIVLTKDMTETIAYLEKHDLMKHFEKSREVGDIKHVKLATMSELYDENKKSDNIPIFYSSYWTANEMSLYSEIRDNYRYDYYFEGIEKTVSDKTLITSLINDSVAFGFCSNDSIIMEITYNDGAVSTVMIPAGSDSIK